MSDPSSLETHELVARCVQAIEQGEADPVDRVCAENPRAASAVRERLARLTNLGLLDTRQTLPSFGPYVIVEKLGAGGMGEVWLAEQTEPVRRKVALKVLQRGLGAADVLARFAVERQALAVMEHANIARIWDAGTTPDGRPFFSMEHVAGRPITDHADAHRLETEQRIALLQPVLEAVHHAHQRGILHRDLKPSNILVATTEAGGEPKVIDFGLAKSLAVESTQLTEAGRLLGTPEYASPEQAAGEPVDVRTDVYALGVVLYELLTGTRPASDPATPSSSITKLPDDSPVLDARVSTKGELRKLLAGELDWITMKALTHDPEHRYATVREMADDLARYRANEPVLAAPPSLTYRVRKAVRRHRVAIAIGAVAAVGLAIGGGGLVLGAIRADREKRQAAADYADMIASVDNWERMAKERLEGKPGSTALLAELRREAVRITERLLTRRQTNPRLIWRAASAHRRLAQALDRLGDPAGYQAELSRARELLARVPADCGEREAADRVLMIICSQLQAICRGAKDLDGAARAFEDGYRIATMLLDRHPGDRQCKNVLARLHAGRGYILLESDHETALDHMDEALKLVMEEQGAAIDGSQLKELCIQLESTATACARAGKFERADELMQRSQRLLERALADAPDTRNWRSFLASTLNLRALIAEKQAAPEEAEAMLRRSVAMYEALAEDYPDDAPLARQRAQVYRDLATSVLDRAHEDPELIHEVIRLAERGVEAGRRSLANGADGITYTNAPRTLLELLRLCRIATGGAGPEVAALAREAAKLPFHGSHTGFRRRHRAALRRWKQAKAKKGG